MKGRCMRIPLKLTPFVCYIITVYFAYIRLQLPVCVQLYLYYVYSFSPPYPVGCFLISLIPCHHRHHHHHLFTCYT